MVNSAKHDHLILLITDFAGADEQTRRLVTKLSARNDVLACLVYDPLGISLPLESSVRATDGSQTTTVHPASRFEQEFKAGFLARCQQIRKILSALRIPILPICTHEPVVDQVMYALGAKS